MPTYEYRCKDCGLDLEVVQSFSDEPLTRCEACGGTLRKVFGSIGISFKGSGFYKTDSRSSGSSTKAGSTASSESSTSGTSGSSPSGTSGSSPSTTSGSSSSGTSAA